MGNVHSLASYLVDQTGLVFSSSNVEPVYFAPVGEDSVLVARSWRHDLLLAFSSRYPLQSAWIDFVNLEGSEESEASLSKQDFTDRGLEFYTDFARDSADVSWIAFPEYRLALGKRASVPPWIPLPHWS